MFKIAACTTAGRVKAVNQDSYDVMRIDTAAGEVAFAVLCDGMGGLANGELASRTVTDAFRNWALLELSDYLKTGIDKNEVRRAWTHIVKDCHIKIAHYASSHNTRMGTTAVAMLIVADEYFLMNIGDSRAYELTDHAEILTRDHVFETEMLERGEMTEEELKNDKRRYKLTRCIGALPDADPEFFFGNIKNGAVYLLCSDGFRRKLSPEEITGAMAGSANSDAAVLRKSIDKLIGISLERTERDNITAVAVTREG